MKSLNSAQDATFQKATVLLRRKRLILELKLPPLDLFQKQMVLEQIGTSSGHVFESICAQRGGDFTKFSVRTSSQRQ
jgi:hypothetical protein